VHGKFQKTITVTTNDPVRPNLLLRLEGEVKSALAAEPQAVGFGLVVEDSQGEERRVKLTAASEDPVKVSLPPEIPGGRIRYALETKVPGKEYELVLRMVPPFVPGPVNESVVLILDHPRQKSFEVRSSATVAPRLSLEPSTLPMSDVPAGQPFRGQVRFENRGARLVKVLSTKPGAPQVSVTVAEVVPGRTYDLRLEAPGDFVPPAQGTPVEVQTDDPARPSMTFLLQPKPVPPSSPSLLVGKPAPAFSIKSVGGREVSNATAARKVTLLDFFAADCPHCKRQIPRLATAMKMYAGQPVQLVLIAQKMRSDYTADQVREILKSSGVDPGAFELVVDMANVPGKAFLVNSYPALVVLGKDGKVAAAISGDTGDLESRVKGQVDALLSGKPVPPSDTPAVAPVLRPVARPAAQPRGGAPVKLAPSVH